MEVLLLGAGSADGWPSAFCRCDSCLAMRRQGVLRTPTSVLVDGRLWIDPGPEAPRQALRSGVDLAEVEFVLVTHAHTDHLDPAFLLHRGWVSDQPLTVVGPAPVMARCREWLAPGQETVRLVEVTAGDRLDLGPYRVLTVPARHEALGECVLYRVDDGRCSVLYACDTGPWADGAIDLLRGTRLDLVLLEQTFGDRDDLAGEGHLSLTTFAAAVDALRAAGCSDRDTRVLAVHLSHHNPPDVADRLAAGGVETGHDGARVRLGQ